MRLKLSDMTPELRARVEKAMNKKPVDLSAYTLGKLAKDGILTGVSVTTKKGKPPAITSTFQPVPKVTKRGPNKTESVYNLVCLHSLGMYEAITLRLPGGSRYTPDWITVQGSQVTCHECKGAYRHASQGRALTAFRECVAAFPFFRFVWAVREADGWKVNEYGGVK